MTGDVFDRPRDGLDARFGQREPIDERWGGPLFLTKTGYVVAVGLEQLCRISSKPPSDGVKRLIFLTTAGAGKLA